MCRERACRWVRGREYPFLTSKERDIETGLDYFNARYFSSVQGRFTSVDPILSSANPTQPQTWNRYTYCLNNPLNIVDPTGMWNWSAALGGDQSDDQLRGKIKGIQNNADLTAEQRTAQVAEINNILTQRQQFKEALQLAKDIVERADISSEQAGAARAILRGFGTENDGNGVILARSTDTGGAAFTREEGGKIIVAITPGEFAKGTLWSSVFHEGVHVFQSRLRSIFGVNPSVASMEYQAYHGTASLVAGIDSAFVRVNRAAEGPGSYSVGPPPVVIWQRGWAEADMKNGIEQHLRNKGYLDSNSRETVRGSAAAFPGGGAGRWQ